MSAFSAIPLEKLPPVTVVERKSHAEILAEITAWLVDRNPDLEPVLSLESDPLSKILEAWAYREMLLRAEFDDAGRGNMLAFATGASLDHLGALFGVARAVVQPADNNAIPPVPEIMEADDRFRSRIQLSLERATTAGPRGSYQFWGLSASAKVKDIGLESPAPGQVRVTVLSSEGDGVPDAATLEAVSEKLNDEDVRPLTDQVIVQGAAIRAYAVEASLMLYAGPDGEIVRKAAETAARAYVTDRHRLGHDVTISGLHAALHQVGVQNVQLVQPAGDIVIGPAEAAFCPSDEISVVIGGRNV